jgi:hypothetical protein
MHNITELRQSLLANYIQIKAGKMGLNTAKELSNHAGKIINSLKVELEYNQMLGIKTKIDFLEHGNSN